MLICVRWCYCIIDGRFFFIHLAFGKIFLHCALFCIFCQISHLHTPAVVRGRGIVVLVLACGNNASCPFGGVLVDRLRVKEDWSLVSGTAEKGLAGKRQERQVKERVRERLSRCLPVYARTWQKREKISRDVEHSDNGVVGANSEETKRGEGERGDVNDGART